MEIGVDPCFLIEGELPPQNLLVGELGSMGCGKGLFARLPCLSYGNSRSGKDEGSRSGWEGYLLCMTTAARQFCVAVGQQTLLLANACGWADALADGRDHSHSQCRFSSTQLRTLPGEGPMTVPGL